jgi:hypothetical protein
MRRDPWQLDNVADTRRYTSTQAYLARRLSILAQAPPRAP